MANILLAPVWSIGWKIALIVLLSLAVLICALLIAYAVIVYRRREKRAPEDEFQVPDDGGFGSIVDANKYGVVPPAGAEPIAQNVHLPAPGRNAQPVYMQPQQPYMPSAMPIPADISQRVGYDPGQHFANQPYAPVQSGADQPYVPVAPAFSYMQAPAAAQQTAPASCPPFDKGGTKGG